MYYVLGLGNPGDKYEMTRHNVGRLMLQEMVSSGGVTWNLDKNAKALRAKFEIGGEVIDVLLPETYMNQSGQTAKFLVDKCAANLSELVVVYDDVDLAFGEIKISFGKGDGGHNGIKSIVNSIKSKDFIRVRIGVSSKSFWTGKVKRPSGSALPDYVLGKFSKSEQKNIEEISLKVKVVLETIITEGYESAMNRFN